MTMIKNKVEELEVEYRKVMTSMVEMEETSVMKSKVEYRKVMTSMVEMEEMPLGQNTLMASMEEYKNLKKGKVIQICPTV